MSTELSDIAKASARGSFFLFLGNTSSTTIMALASILIARLLGPENYGLYSLAMIAPSLLTALSDIGISPALTMFSARFHSEGKNWKVVGLIKAGIIFKSIFSLLLSIVLLLLSESIATWVLKRPGLVLLIRFTSLYLVGQGLVKTLESIFIGLDKTENSALLMNIQAITKAVTSPLLIILGMGAIGAILGAGLGFLLAAGMGVTILLLGIRPRLYGRNHGENVDFFQGLRLMIPYGMPLYLSTLTATLFAQYQCFILAFFASNMEIGNYTIAMNFSAMITLLFYPIAISLFPAFSKLNIEENRDKVQKMFKLSVKYTSLLVIPASFAVAVLSKEAVYTLYGFQYGFAPSYLALYVLSFLYTGLGMGVMGSLFNGQGDTKTTLRIDIINLSLSMPLTFVFTFLYGVPGLVTSFLISQFLSTTYGLFLVYKKYAVMVDWASSLRTGVASLSSTLLTHLFLTLVPLSNPVYKLAAGGLLYIMSFLIFAPLTGAVNISDIVNLREILSELGPLTPLFNIPLNLVEKTLMYLQSRPK